VFVLLRQFDHPERPAIDYSPTGLLLLLWTGGPAFHLWFLPASCCAATASNSPPCRHGASPPPCSASACSRSPKASSSSAATRWAMTTRWRHSATPSP